MTHCISAVICTRNRGDSAVEAVRSVLANTHVSFEVILVDQSEGKETEQATTRFLSDPRFRYIPTTTVGLGRARNIGLEHALAPIVAFTDDDCSVPENWLEVIERCFAEYSQVTVLFTNVVGTPHDGSAGFVPTYERNSSKVIRSFWSKCGARGIGASMAVRRDPILQIGGFDAMLGAGSQFSSAEDSDIALRAIALGHWVYETDRVAVLHDGYRTWVEGRALARRDWFGIGAAYVKPLRARHWGMILIVLYELIGSCFLEPLQPLLSLRRPRGLGRILAFSRGFYAGLRYPLDKKRIMYLVPKKSCRLSPC
jgi:GT2 family glycosyltransferase